MAYGFNLGQIEGLDSSVQTVTLTIANATESNTYTLVSTSEYTWVSNPEVEPVESEIILSTLNGDGVTFIITLKSFTESDVGDAYNVTLSTSAVEENFKSAVEEVIADNVLTVPFGYSDLLNIVQGYGSKDITTIAETSGINSNNASTYKLKVIMGNYTLEVVYVGTNAAGQPVYSSQWFNKDTDGRLTESYEVLLKLKFQDETVTLFIEAARWNVTAGIPLA